jgi:thioredoxin reductase (NADPH)
MHKIKASLVSFIILGWALQIHGVSDREELLHNPKYGDAHLKDKHNIVHLAIIGSGVAGLSAFIYGARAGFHTVLFQGDKPGGLVADAPFIENWPGIEKICGAAIIEKIEKQARQFGTYILPYTIQKVNLLRWPFELILNDGTVVYALSVVIATGASHRPQGIEGEAQYLRKGVLTCTTCDAPFSKGKIVAIVGNDDATIERALQLAQYADGVILITRDSSLCASPSVQKKLYGSHGIKILYNTEVTKIIGDGTHMTSIELKDMESGKKSIQKLNLIFLSGALKPNSELVKGQLPLDKEGSIMLQCRTQETPITGVTAAGTVADPRYRQACVAAGDGIKAVLDSIHFLRELGFDGPRKQLIQKQLYTPRVSQQSILEPITSIKQFWHLVETAQDYVLVDFYSPLCPVCKRMEPLIGKVSTEYQAKVKALKVDTATFTDLVDHYDIDGLPALLLLRKGKVIGRIEGDQSYAQLVHFFKEHVQ